MEKVQGMTNMWIVVPHWDRFQHYKDRVPPWIKLYTAELAHNPEYARLTAAQRGLLMTCWIEYALSMGQASVEHTMSTLGAGQKHAYLKPLVDAGFVELSASKPLALTRSREVEEEKNKKKTRTRANKELARVFEEDPPPRDPDALTKIQGLANRIGKPL